MTYQQLLEKLFKMTKPLLDQDVKAFNIKEYESYRITAFEVADDGFDAQDIGHLYLYF